MASKWHFYRLPIFGLLVFWMPLHGQEGLTLEQAVQRALQNNPALRAVEDRVGSSRARVTQAESSRLPRLDFKQEFIRSNNPGYVFGTLLAQRQFAATDLSAINLNTPGPLDNFQTRLEGQWLLLDFGRTSSRIRSARRMQTAADYLAEQARQDLIVRVVRSYWGVIVARENFAAALDARSTAEANERRVQSLQEAGIVVSSDLLSARVFRAQMRQGEIRARNAWETARMVLARELGLDLEAPPEPLETLSEPPQAEMPVSEWERVALAERPSLIAARLGLEAARSNLQLARAEFGPTLGVYGNFERDAEALGGPSGTNWTAGARLEINLFNGGGDRSRLEEAVAKEREAQHGLEWIESGVSLEVREAYMETAAAAQRAEAARSSVEEARDSLRIIEDRYQAGLATITDLLRVQTARLEAQASYLAALHDWQVARAQLERAAGRLTLQSNVIQQSAVSGNGGDVP